MKKGATPCIQIIGANNSEPMMGEFPWRPEVVAHISHAWPGWRGIEFAWLIIIPNNRNWIELARNEELNEA